MMNVADVRWNLSAMYSDIADPQIDKDIALLAGLMKKFHADHKGKLAVTLGKAISDYAEISMLGERIGIYLFLMQTMNLSDAVIKAKVAETEKMISNISGEYLTFFEIELVALDDAALDRLFLENPVVARHRPWIEHSRIFKPNFLIFHFEYKTNYFVWFQTKR